MALVKCKECGKEVSKSAKTCPHCGIKDPGLKAGDIWKGIVVTFFVIFIFSQCSDSDDKPTSVDAKPQVSETECLKTLQCWGEKHSINAAVYCEDPIERLAQYSAEWTDGIGSPKFGYYRWKDQSKGYITYIGDELKLQNGFGAWSNYTYECDFDPKTKSVLDVRVSQGKL
ncbi:zinc ribbon domain-containing protein [Shewanella baltica]|uniref:zinc ribbon domain-containing protein n=1 Tax=Shewanella baltica TaxID=62322 RepID=UPI00217F1BBE|nr:zinc ribbon domain-containing protein [Shewanella baltica]MCS6258831.1 zinc ribbon domain-containing protein [Shewanella baltica]